MRKCSRSDGSAIMCSPKTLARGAGLVAMLGLGILCARLNPRLVAQLDRGNAVDLDAVAALVAQGADANARTGDERTVLMVACGCAGASDIRLVRLLLKRGARVSAATPEGYTSLMSAAAGGETRIAETLLQHGADVGKADAEGNTALFWAAAGHTETVRLLLAWGADPEKRNRRGERALDWATRHRAIELGRADGSQLARREMERYFDRLCRLLKQPRTIPSGAEVHQTLDR